MTTTKHTDCSHANTQQARTTCRFVSGLIAQAEAAGHPMTAEPTTDGWTTYKLDSWLTWFAVSVNADGELAFCARGYHGASTDLVYIKCPKRDARYYLGSTIDTLTNH